MATEEQKGHMESLIKQAQELNAEVSQFQQKLQFKRDLLLKVQGAIEYLQQVGVPIPKPETEENESEEVGEETPSAE